MTCCEKMHCAEHTLGDVVAECGPPGTPMRYSIVDDDDHEIIGDLKFCPFCGSDLLLAVVSSDQLEEKVTGPYPGCYLQECGTDLIVDGHLDNRTMPYAIEYFRRVNRLMQAEERKS